MRKSLLLSLASGLLSLLVSGCAMNVSAQSPTSRSADTLYKRLGGYDAIAAVTDEFLARITKDPQISRFLVGLSADSKKRLRQLAVDQLCEATGGPCFYIGRTMKASHAGLGVTESDWDITVKHLVAAIDKFKVPEKEKNEFLAIASQLKADIVEK